MRRLLLTASVGVLAASSAFAQQIPLTPGNVIGSSGSYGGFPATNILDQQSGDISEPANGPINYWINADNGPVNAYIVVDLGAPYQIDSLTLFNTHNRQFNDRGTGQFDIVGANAVTDLGGGNFDITGPSTELVTNGVLAAQTEANDPLDPQSFDVSDTGTYRYLRFEPETVAAGGVPCCGDNVYGLNELRVFQVPEPAGLALLGLGACGALARRRRA